MIRMINEDLVKNGFGCQPFDSIEYTSENAPALLYALIASHEGQKEGIKIIDYMFNHNLVISYQIESKEKVQILSVHPLELLSFIFSANQ